jgi:hypothetical protein
MYFDRTLTCYFFAFPSLFFFKVPGPTKNVTIVDITQEHLEIGLTSLSRLGCLLSLGSPVSKWPS